VYGVWLSWHRVTSTVVATVIYLVAWKDTRRREVPGNVLWIPERDGSNRRIVSSTLGALSWIVVHGWYSVIVMMMTTLAQLHSRTHCFHTRADGSLCIGEDGDPLCMSSKLAPSFLHLPIFRPMCRCCLDFTACPSTPSPMQTTKLFPHHDPMNLVVHYLQKHTNEQTFLDPSC
jgi:hypothetical protein